MVTIGERGKRLETNSSAHVGVRRRGSANRQGWLAGMHRLCERLVTTRVNHRAAPLSASRSHYHFVSRYRHRYLSFPIKSDTILN